MLQINILWLRKIDFLPYPLKNHFSMEARFVYVTCKNKEEAQIVGEAVVRDRLAACANILAGMSSIYWWKGELVMEQEAVLIFKSREELMEKLIEKVKAVHSYAVPCVVALPILEGNPDYLQWIAQETGQNSAPLR